jgi:hypothetical protein
MLFQVTHVHTAETCPGAQASLLPRYAQWWQELKNNPNVKVLAAYVSPMDHTFHITVDAEDFPTIARALGPLNAIGSGHTSPVITLDQALPMADQGAFR